MTTISTFAIDDRSSRWLLVGSLALNLFFVGAAGALAARHYFTRPSPVHTERPRTAAARIDRLAATLPSADADKLRSEFQRRATTVEGVRETYDRGLEYIRDALRAEPFDVGRLRAAMTETRPARLALDQVLQEVIATAAPEMSAQGRNKLADWSLPSRPAAVR